MASTAKVRSRVRRRLPLVDQVADGLSFDVRLHFHILHHETAAREGTLQRRGGRVHPPMIQGTLGRKVGIVDNIFAVPIQSRRPIKQLDRSCARGMLSRLGFLWQRRPHGPLHGGKHGTIVVAFPFGPL